MSRIVDYLRIPRLSSIREAYSRLCVRAWMDLYPETVGPGMLAKHAAKFGDYEFVERMRKIEESL